MKFYCVYEENIFFKFKKFFLNSEKYKILYWKRGNKKKVDYIPFPNRSKYYKYHNESKKLVFSYFIKFYQSLTDRHLNDYFLKNVVNDFQDYYYFRKSVENIENNDIIIIDKEFFNNIYKKSQPKINLYSFFKISYESFYAFMHMVKFILINFKSFSKKLNPDVIFLMKNSIPTARSNSVLLNKKIFKNKGIKQNNVAFGFSSKTIDGDTFFLNSFYNSKKISLISLYLTYKNLFFDLNFIFKAQLPKSYVFYYLINTYKSFFLVKLNPKVIFGVLEKNYCILVNRYKTNSQKTCTFSDGLSFYPNVSIINVHADIFYSINKINTDHAIANNWSIGRIKEVGFISADLRADSKGLSSDLKLIYKKFDFKVLVALSQTLNNQFYTIDQNYLESFLEEILKISNIRDNYLFIVKEKKGEFDLISEDLMFRLEKKENVQLIAIDRIDKVRLNPYLSKFNHFEDLLDKSDLVLSLAWESTVIWQSLKKKKLAIAYNNSFEQSFLKNYIFLESNKKNLLNALDFWKNASKKEISKFFKNINIDTNIHYSGGMSKMIKDIVNIIE